MPASSEPPLPAATPEPPVDRSPAALLAQMSLDEKAAMTAGRDVWTVPGVARLGVPDLKVTDGPNGARGEAIFGGTSPSLCVPCGSALGATFDTALITRVGAALGRDALRKRSRVLLAPTINLPRSPLYGRAFECYSEDPRLAGAIAASFVRGVQSEGVATTPKHFVGNETEFQRLTINSVIDERTLREVYLLPFEWAVRNGGALGIMTAYNRLNGAWCSTDPHLLRTILRDEWGFEGFVVSDWFAAGETVKSLEAGLDLQMPGPDRYFGAPVAAAVREGRVDEGLLDDVVFRRLNLHTRLRAWENEASLPEHSEETVEDRALAHEAAVASTVLLSNDGLLPLAPGTTVALIGPNAERAHIMGGGSAHLTPHRRPSLASVMRERLGDDLQVSRGCIIDKTPPALRPDAGFNVEFFSATDLSGPVVGSGNLAQGTAVWVGEPTPGLGADPFSARLTGVFTPDVSGAHTFMVVQTGGARLRINGEIIIDGVANPPGPGEAFFGFGSEEMYATVELVQDQTVEVVVDVIVGPGTGVRGVNVGHAPPVSGDLIGEAVKMAAACDVAVVIVGTSSEWETEGNDRQTLDLPGDQDRLVEAVAAANPRTCVVVNAGAPVVMPWADQVQSVIVAWLGGQEMSPAVDAVLFGDADPGGRLPVTFPFAIEHTPAFGNFPGEDNETRYGEGLLTGWRWYDTRYLPVQWAFGQGGSYATFDWSNPEIEISGEEAGDAHVLVAVDVRNTSDRAGTEVVQLYAEMPTHGLVHERRRLVGWAKCHLSPGGVQRIEIEVRPRDLAHWEQRGGTLRELREKLGNVEGGLPGEDATDGDDQPAGWYLAGGDWTFDIARSAVETVHRLQAEVHAAGPLVGPENDL